jgi:hypothetical protein
MFRLCPILKRDVRGSYRFKHSNLMKRMKYIQA